jgi:hypothetical protein
MFWLFVGLLTIGLLFSLMNWMTIYTSYREKRFCSAVPLIGAVFLIPGFLGLSTLRPFWWTAFIIDYGTLILIVSLPMLIRQFWFTRRK